ncbi:hypothetical protein [Bacillus sp. 2205SS5-2]|uniref:hypothetical protein n=1 Tax=Bacillus sp. 2205SS5-2 TaxID=3109031 RepID=UPI003006244C
MTKFFICIESNQKPIKISKQSSYRIMVDGRLNSDGSITIHSHSSLALALQSTLLCSLPSKNLPSHPTTMLILPVTEGSTKVSVWSSNLAEPLMIIHISEMKVTVEPHPSLTKRINQELAYRLVASFLVRQNKQQATYLINPQSSRRRREKNSQLKSLSRKLPEDQ